jgi:hypothetical protein
VNNLPIWSPGLPAYLVQMFAEFFGGLHSFPLLHVQHHSQRFAGLEWMTGNQDPPSVLFICLIRDRCYDFLNIFAENLAKNLALFAQNKAKLCKNWIITLVFEKNANLFAENWQKSQKIVIITSTPALGYVLREIIVKCI